jgi:SSS family solute:Na+ symporter
VSPRLLAIVAYGAALIALGLWLGRRVRGTRAFFVGGRSLGAGLLGTTVLAANIGAGSTVGAAGLGYRDGLAAWWWVGSAAIGTMVLAWWAGPRLRALAATHGLTTMGDFLELRFGRETRALVTALLWVGTLAILAGQLIGIAWVMDAVAGTPKWLGCVVGGAVMVAYFAAGGLQGSAWVNLMQLVVLLVGFAVALPLALAAAGGWDVVRGTAAVVGAQGAAAPGGFTGSGWHYLLLLAPAFVVSPGLVQKAYGGRDDRAVRLGIGWSAVALLAFAVVPPLLGLAARTLHPGLSTHELALPTLLAQDLPAWLGTLGLAALFSAEVSTADALLFMLATSLSRDLYQRFLRPRASDREVLRVARWAAVLGGGLGTALAIASPSIVAALSLFYGLMGASLFVPVVTGLAWPAAPKAVGLWGAACGALGMLAAQVWGASWGVPASLVGLGASAAGAAIGTAWSYLRRDIR